MKSIFGFSFLLMVVSLVNSKDLQEKSGKDLLSLFSVVTFQNGECKSTSTVSTSNGATFRNGTCFTTEECSSKGGVVNGNCAAGFGVCCVFTLVGSGTVKQNCTYLQNEGFGAAYAKTDAVKYTINKCTNCLTVCELRLDFETFVLVGPAGSLEVAGGACDRDTFTAKVDGGEQIPVICGSNSGQQMYLNIGREDTATATLTFAFNGASTVRMWDIKVTYIPCNSKGDRPFHGCLQYFTGLSGRFQTFNFADTKTSHLANQAYSACIKQEPGYCCIQYEVCTDANSFNLYADPANVGKARTDSNCPEDYIGLEGASATCSTSTVGVPRISKFCGAKLSTVDLSTTNSVVCDCSTPFKIDVFTDATSDDVTQNQRGVCLVWKQLPCGSK